MSIEITEELAGELYEGYIAAYGEYQIEVGETITSTLKKMIDQYFDSILKNKKECIRVLYEKYKRSGILDDKDVVYYHINDKVGVKDQLPLNKSYSKFTVNELTHLNKYIYYDMVAMPDENKVYKKYTKCQNYKIIIKKKKEEDTKNDVEISKQNNGQFNLEIYKFIDFDNEINFYKFQALATESKPYDLDRDAINKHLQTTMKNFIEELDNAQSSGNSAEVQRLLLKYFKYRFDYLCYKSLYAYAHLSGAKRLIGGTHMETAKIVDAGLYEYSVLFYNRPMNYVEPEPEPDVEEGPVDEPEDVEERKKIEERKKQKEEERKKKEEDRRIKKEEQLKKIEQERIIRKKLYDEEQKKRQRLFDEEQTNPILNFDTKFKTSGFLSNKNILGFKYPENKFLKLKDILSHSIGK